MITKLIRLIMFVIALLSFVGIKAQTFSQCVNEAEMRIKKLKRVEELIASSIQNDEMIEANANMTLNPQKYIDLVLVRYLRNMHKVQLAIVESATQSANDFCKFIGKNTIDQRIVSQGIAKYTDIASFSYKWSQELEEQFLDKFSKYLYEYGDDCERIFREDDLELLHKYGVN